MNKRQYRVIRKGYSAIIDGQRVRLPEGAIFVPSDSEIRAHSDRLEPVEQSEDGLPAGVMDCGSGWYELPDGSKVRGIDAVKEAVSGGQGD